jgi:hypothetical protein
MTADTRLAEIMAVRHGQQFRHGHVRRLQPCMACGNATRRTVPCPGRLPGETDRYVLCTRCELPDAETRLLMAIFGVGTVPQLEAKARRGREQEPVEQRSGEEASR